MTAIPRFNVNNYSSKDSDSKMMNHEGGNALGFGNIPEQMHRKAVKKGFNFTIMVVGESGLGKSTFINTLLMTDLYKDREYFNVAETVEMTTKVVKRFIELDEKGVKLRLTIIDTPGFGDAVNCEDCWKPIEEYIDGAFDQYFKEECGLNRKNILDNRVHCCLYFVSPLGRGLRPLDVQTIKRLQNRVNIVPVIAKADCLTASELANLKRTILSDIDRHQLEVYRLPDCDSDEEETIRKLDRDIKLCLPFSVIGTGLQNLSNSDNNTTNNHLSDTQIRGRKYPWGCAEVGSDKHCDFNKLRVFLLKTHMQDLKDMTSEVLYENYRAQCITERMTRRQTERQGTPSLDASGTPKVGGTGSGSMGNQSRSGYGSSGIAGSQANGSDISEPGFEAIVDPENLLLHKEKEIEQMRQLCEKLQSQLQQSPQQSSA